MRLSQFILESNTVDEFHDLYTGSFKGSASSDNIIRKSKADKKAFEYRRMEWTKNTDMRSLFSFLTRLSFTGEVEYTIVTPKIPPRRDGYKVEYKTTTGTFTYLALKLKKEEDIAAAQEFGFTKNGSMYEIRYEPMDMEVKYIRNKSEAPYSYDASIEVSDMKKVRKELSVVKMSGQVVSSSWVDHMMDLLEDIGQTGMMYLQISRNGIRATIIYDDPIKFGKIRSIVGHGMMAHDEGDDTVVVQTDSRIVRGWDEDYLKDEKSREDHISKEYYGRGRYEGD